MGRPDLVRLRHIVRRLSRLPYENISKILGSRAAPTRLEALRLPGRVAAEHLERGFGGTCYSLTFLAERLLTHLGYDCYKAAADMRLGPDTHSLVVVSLGESRYIVDPGYALSEVVELPGAGSIRTRCPHGDIELEREGKEDLNLWTVGTPGRRWRYRLKDRPVEDSDFETLWIRSFDMPTMRNICVNRMSPDGHVYFRKDYLRITSRRGTDKRRLKGGAGEIVEEIFGIERRWVGEAQDILRQRRERSCRS
jgi:arylamine N-acetyltransferase